MGKNPFGMYDGIRSDGDAALPVETGDVEDIELMKDLLDKPRDPEYSVSRSYSVPNGRYLVRARAKVKSCNNRHMARWVFDAQGFQVYDTPLIPVHWSERDSDWIDDVVVDNGKLSLKFTLSRNSNFLKKAYVEWIEFSYRRKNDG